MFKGFFSDILFIYRQFFLKRGFSLFLSCFFVLIFLFFLGFLSESVNAVGHLTIYSPNYFNEQKNEFNQIHFLSDELLSFQVCFDDPISNLSVFLKDESLSDGSKRFLYPKFFVQNCYFVNFMLNRTNFSDFSLHILYTENNKRREIVRNFKRVRESNLPSLILDRNYKSLSSLELSYFLLVLSNFKPLNNDFVREIYNYLKNKRDNVNKCWPAGKCSVPVTAEILRNLHFAGYDLNSRIFNDGLIFIEKNVNKYVKGKNSFASDDYKVMFFIRNNFSESGAVDCDLETNDKTYSYEFDSSDDFQDLNFEKSVDSSFEFKCDNSLDVIKYYLFKNTVKDNDYDDINHLSYEVSDYLKNRYHSFYYIIKLEDDFTSENSCRLIIDGSEKKIELDSSSSEDDKFLEGFFNDNVELKCDNDINKVYFYVLSDKVEDKKFSNKDSVSGSVDVGERFSFNISLVYDFSNSNSLKCKLDVDDGIVGHYYKEYEFEKGDDLVIDNNYLSKSVRLSCDRKVYNMRLRVYNNFGNPEVDELYDDVSDFSFNLPDDFSLFACVENNGECDIEATFDSVIAYGSNLESYNKLKRYLENFIVKSNDNYERFNTHNSIIDSGKYLLIESDVGVKNFLKYSQNNDGSWGSKNKIIDTSWAVIGLNAVSSSDSEHLKDGLNWIYFNEPLSGWGSLCKNSLAYEAIKEKIKSRIVVSDVMSIGNSTEISIFNPTIYNLRNLRLIFSKEINDYIKGAVDLGDLKKGEVVRTNLSTVSDFICYASGFVTFEAVDEKNNKVELLKIPIKIEGKAPFFPKDYSIVITNSHRNVVVPIEKSDSKLDLKCDFKNPFTERNEKVIINSKVNEITFSNNKLVSGVFNLIFNCVDKSKKRVIVPFKFNLSVANESFKFEDSVISVDSKGSYSFRIKNLKGEKLFLKVDIPKNLEDFVVFDTNHFVLAPNEVKEIYFDVLDFDKLRESANSVSFLFSDRDGFSQKLLIKVGSNFESSNSSFSFWDYFLFFVIGLSVLVVLGYFYKRYREYQYYIKEVENESEELDDEEIIFDLKD